MVVIAVVMIMMVVVMIVVVVMVVMVAVVVMMMVIVVMMCEERPDVGNDPGWLVVRWEVVWYGEWSGVGRSAVAVVDNGEVIPHLVFERKLIIFVETFRK